MSKMHMLCWQDTDILDKRDWFAILRFYRVLRIRIPILGDDEQAVRTRAECRHEGMTYGMSREQAKRYLRRLVTDLSWADYISTK